MKIIILPLLVPPAIRDAIQYPEHPYAKQKSCETNICANNRRFIVFAR